MQFVTKLVISLSLLVAPAWAQEAINKQAPKTPSAIAREQATAVVLVEALDERGTVLGQGSGFIVTSQGAVVTSLHVIQGAAAVRVKLPNGDLYKTTDLIDVDDTKDLAVLKLKGFQLPTVRLGDSDRAEIGEAVVAISSPEGLTNTLSTGVLSGMRRLEGLRVFQITAPISAGSSGGALFNSNGEVIGVITYVLKGGQNINFAVPINYVRGMIGEQATKTLTQLPRPAAVRESATTPNAAAEQSGEEVVTGRLSEVVRGRLGRSPLEPVFVRPDQALRLFTRLVESIGLYRESEIAELLTTAAISKTKETATIEEYTITHLSQYTGLTLGINKTDRRLASVELLVNWTIADLERTFGEDYRQRTTNGQKYLEIKQRKEDRQMIGSRQIVALLDANGNVTSVRFTKGK